MKAENPPQGATIRGGPGERLAAFWDDDKSPVWGEHNGRWYRLCWKVFDIKYPTPGVFFSLWFFFRYGSADWLKMNPIERILQQMADDEVYEVTPLSGIHKAAALPRGYCGEAYHRDDPRLAIRLKELLEAGWSLPER